MRSEWALAISTILFVPIVPLLAIAFFASTTNLVAVQEVKVKKVPITQSDAASSKQMFLDYCAPCRGTLGIRP